jgi:hypothetical protein
LTSFRSEICMGVPCLSLGGASVASRVALAPVATRVQLPREALRVVFFSDNSGWNAGFVRSSKVGSMPLEVALPARANTESHQANGNALWYLVKTNWPATTVRRPDYAGVGGDVWPLDAISDRKARAVHERLMAGRSDLDLGGTFHLLCLDRLRAEEYWEEAKRHRGEVWLLELAPGAGATEAYAGFDLGFPSGGGSIVESELITQGRMGPLLNRWGLFDSEEDAMSYLANRTDDQDLEDASAVELLAVRVLRR